MLLLYFHWFKVLGIQSYFTVEVESPALWQQIQFSCFVSRERKKAISLLSIFFCIRANPPVNLFLTRYVIILSLCIELLRNCC